LQLYQNSSLDVFQDGRSRHLAVFLLPSLFAVGLVLSFCGAGEKAMTCVLGLIQVTRGRFLADVAALTLEYFFPRLPRSKVPAWSPLPPSEIDVTVSFFLCEGSAVGGEEVDVGGPSPPFFFFAVYWRPLL